jgi:low temperature requirement protein LtrA
MEQRKRDRVPGGGQEQRRRAPSFTATDESHRVTTLELLFDLVFVFAVTSITSFMAHSLTTTGLLEGLVIAMLMWFGWTAYAWLGNQAHADRGALRISMLFAMAAFFLVALTIPEAFEDRPGGLSGPVVFVSAYAVVRFSHLAVYTLAAGDDHELRRTVRQAFVSTLPAIVLLGVGAFCDEHWRLALWSVAVVTDYAGIFVSGATGWRVPAPGHFAERHQLVVIIAIGESVVGAGLGLEEAPVDWALLLGAVLAILISITLWWTYFDVVAMVAERTLTTLRGDDRTRLARDTFTYLHMPVVVGILYLALGTKVVLTQAAAATEGEHAAFSGPALFALYGGAALYLTAMSAIRWRDIGGPNVQRLVVAGVLVLTGLAADVARLTGVVNLAIVAVLMASLVAYETVRHRETREAVREEGEPSGDAAAATEPASADEEGLQA